MKEPKKIGMLTPSSNTALEPICSRMLHDVPEVTCHYSRFEVTKISLEQDSLSQFNMEPMLRAAELLAHAEVDVIAWNGTSGGWIGFDVDRKLCEAITERTGIPATTSMLSQIRAFKEHDIKSVHLVTPYIPEINKLIAKQYKEQCGIETVNISGLDITHNRSFSLVSQERIEDQIKEVTVSPADALSVVCTNFPAVSKVEYYEEKYNIPMYDTINVLMWECLKMVDIDPNILKEWGKVFSKVTVNN
ncbi:aspartate/glutamate racemase family protein [Neobacillus cucumis]|uniref:maleate cis-trans isomerase family protein n=1 Tax=Neobacillus cucumis TaxID=1740721 RepID=UPI0018DFE92A|nr:aspartate/glutamate racemase family protein [Neobacillus cucumis]MBI0579631.1 aspartate/glutamate racemase family protein [Neobacillus cucumis]WHY93259.1 aspartate/glutamate racemase family protein [Neobacillus cucumis]